MCKGRRRPHPVQSAKNNVHKDSYYRLAKCKSVAAQSIITGAQILEAFKAN